MIYVSSGRRETGKTTLAYSMMLRVPDAYRTIFDPRRQLLTSEHVPSLEPEDQDERETIVFPDNPAVDFPAFCDTLKMWIEDEDSRVTRAILVDEIRFVDLSDVGFEWLLRCAARQTIHVFMTAHRPIDVPPDIRAIADVWCFFHTTEESDLSRIEERAGPSFRRKVEQLHERQFLVWDDAHGRAIEYHAPSTWFVDIKSPAAVPVGR